MSITLSQAVSQRAILSIERYFAEHMDEQVGERMGNMAAGALLKFFVEEIGPSIYNQAVADVQAALAPRVAEFEARVAEVDIDVHATEFAYWRKFDKARQSPSTTAHARAASMQESRLCCARPKRRPDPRCAPPR